MNSGQGYHCESAMHSTKCESDDQGKGPTGRRILPHNAGDWAATSPHWGLHGNVDYFRMGDQLDRMGGMPVWGMGISRQVDTSEPGAIAGVSADAMIAAHAMNFRCPFPRSSAPKTQSVSHCTACGEVRFECRAEP